MAKLVRKIHDLRRGNAKDLFTGRLRLHRGARVEAVTMTDDEQTMHVHTDKMPRHTPVDMLRVRITRSAPMAGELELFQDNGVRLCGMRA